LSNNGTAFGNSAFALYLFIHLINEFSTEKLNNKYLSDAE